MSVNYEQLESEADAIINSLNNPSSNPTPNPDTEDEDKDVKPDDTDVSEENTDEEIQTEEKSSPADNADTGGLDGLTTDNSAERIKNAQARMTRATMEAAESRRLLVEEKRKSQSLESEMLNIRRDMDSLKAKDTDDRTRKPDSPDSIGTLEALISEYPEIMTPVVKTLKQMRAELAELKGTTITREEATMAEKTRRSQDAHLEAIRTAHPDFNTVANSGEFSGWLDRQPDTYRIYLYGDGIKSSPYSQGGSSTQVIGVFDTYKQSIGQSNRADRSTQAREAASPTLRRSQPSQPNGRPAFTRIEIDRMSPDEYTKREKEIDEAMAAGRVT